MASCGLEKSGDWRSHEWITAFISQNMPVSGHQPPFEAVETEARGGLVAGLALPG